MIIVRLTGGLGNQLFQYAFARSLAYNMNQELFLDISIFNHFELRNHVVFGLGSFNIKAIIGYFPYVEKTPIGFNNNKEHKLTKYIEGGFPDSIYDWGVVKKLDNIKLPAFFQGFYQTQFRDKFGCYITENFFKDNSELIHEEFRYIQPLSINSKNLIEDMKKYDSVALQVRRGDYGYYPKFGFCSLEYYQNSINFLTQELDNPKFYVFTEDPKWAKENLKFDSPSKFIIFNEDLNSAGRAYGELLKLLSSCKHFILSNSTFCWWGSFLSENINKKIIAPTPWFQDRTILGCDTIDGIKTIDLKNSYESDFIKSNNILFNLNKEDIVLEEVNINYSGSGFDIFGNENSKIFFKNLKQKETINSSLILEISLKTNCFNGLTIFYKTNDKDYCEENSRSFYYYKNEDLTHYVIIPNNALLDSIYIKPFILQKEKNDFISIHSIIIKELDD